MSVIELKRNFHELIDSIENEGVLINFYELMKIRATSQDGYLWDKLSLMEQNELLQTLEETKYVDNLINHSEIVNKHSKWL